MSKLYANLDLMIDSMSTLTKASERPDSTISSIQSSINNIQAVGDKHDSCFSGVSDDIVYSFFTNSGGCIRSLVSVIGNAAQQSSDYSNSKISDMSEFKFLSDKYKIDSQEVKGDSKYLRWMFNNKNIPLSEKIADGASVNGFDYNYYNSKLSKFIEEGKTQRDKAVNAALYMSMEFPRLNYFWGGGHSQNVKGIDPTWGEYKTVTSPNDETTGKDVPYSMDCSGYVDWLLYNSGVTTERINSSFNTDPQHTMGTSIKVDDTAGARAVKPGDFAFKDLEHVGLVVGVDGNNITVSHICGSGHGMSLTTVNTETGLVVEDSNLASRVGEPYFTDFVTIKYDDELSEEERAQYVTI